MRILIFLLALVSLGHAQTYRTVTADTNNVIRTNFTIGSAQVSGAFAISNITGLQSALDGKLATNGDGSGLTNLPNADLGSATGILPLSNGGTGQTNAALAIEALLPAYTNNADKILALNSNATGLIWTTNGGGGGLPETPLSVTNGGTGGTNEESALRGLGIIALSNGISIGSSTTNGVSAAAGKQIVIGNGAASTTTNDTSSIAIGAETVVTNRGVAIGWRSKSGAGVSIGSETDTLGNGVAIGRSATAFNGTVTNQAATNDKLHGGIAIGPWADGGYGGSGGGIAIGFLSWADNYGVALGWRATSTNGGFALGYRARSHAGIQLLTGTNNNTNTIQLLTAGSVDTNEWAALANVSSIGTNVMRTTNATWLTNSTASGFRSEIGLPLSALTNTSNTDFQGAVFSATTTNAPTNTNAPTPDAWLDIRVGTNDYKLPLWQ